MRWGIALESLVAAAYTEETGRKVRRARRMLRHRDLPWRLASLDRVVVGELRLLEIKTARFADEAWGATGTDEIPDHVRIQVEHQMAVTGYPLADVAVLFSGSELRHYTIERDDGIQGDLLELEQAFWNAVQARHLPAEIADLGARPLPLREGEVLATPEVTSLVAELRVARSSFDQAEATRDALDVQLRDALADIGTVRGEGFRISYRRNKDSVKVGWEQVAAAYRRLIEEHGLDSTAGGLDGGLDAIQSLFTRISPGARPLRLTYSKETTDDAPL